MENNKIIIIALIAIIAILIVGIVVAMMPNFNKTDTNLDFKSKSKLEEGSYLKIKLTDLNGNPIAGQDVNVTITDKNDASDYHSVVTNSEGIGKLKMEKGHGKYEVTITYGGNDQYNGCNATKKITIKEKEEEASTESSGPSAIAYKSDGTPMYSQSEVDSYMLNKYGMVDYHIGSNGYIDMDEPGYDDAGNYIGYY